MKGLILGLALLSCVAVEAAENRTKLVVGITVSHFYPEWLSIYRNDLSENGFGRLLREGRRTMADYNYLFSQTGTDQTTIYTGLLPSEHGMISHDWFDRLRRHRRNNISSADFPLIGEEGEGAAPEAVQAMTIGCAMKMNDVFSKVYSIAIDAEEAVLAGGSCADMAFWMSEKTGKWVSSAYYADSLPGWVDDYNARGESEAFIRQGWMSLADEEGNATALRWKSKLGLNHGFFYDLAQAKRKYNTYRILKATPYANTAVAHLAEELLKAEQLGYDNDPDLLAIGFSCLDYMNRDFTIQAREFQDVVMRLDRDLERLFATLDQRVGKGNYTVFLTFTEARELLPDELLKMRLPAGYFSVFKAVALLKSFLNLMYGEGDWVADYDSGQIYLDRELIEKRKIPLNEIQDKVAGFLVEFEGVSRVVTAHALTHNASASGLDALFRNAFSQKRSGDVLFALESVWLPELKEMEDNYARYSKRHQVPLFLYGAALPSHIPEKLLMTDLYPLLYRVVGMPE